jgi:hypothetical protein
VRVLAPLFGNAASIESDARTHRTPKALRAKSGGTRCPQRVGKRQLRPCRLIICALDDSVCHRSEPDWHFQEKPIHPWRANGTHTLTFLGSTRWQKGTAALPPDICAFDDSPSAIGPSRTGIFRRSRSTIAPRWNVLSSTRWLFDAALPPDIYTFGDSVIVFGEADPPLGSEVVDPAAPDHAPVCR